MKFAEKATPVLKSLQGWVTGVNLLTVESRNVADPEVNHLGLLLIAQLRMT